MIDILDRLRRHRLPVMRQAEMAECGLASLAMIAAYHGHRVDLNGLRQRFALSLKGATVVDLMAIAGTLGFSCRPLRLEPVHLTQLALPAILHWDLNHFVVLKEIRGDHALLHDPALGRRQISLARLSQHFSGVALEIAPTADFRPREIRIPVGLGDLWTRLQGWQRAFVQVLLLSVLLQLFALAAPSYLRLAIDEALSRFDDQLLAVLAVGFAAMYLIQTATEALRGWVILQIGQMMGYQMMGNVLHHLLRLPASFFEKRIVGDILSRMSSVRPIQQALAQSVVTALIDGLMAVTTATLLFLYSPLLGGIVVGSVLLHFAIVAASYPLRRMGEEEHLVAQAEAQSYLIESIRASKTVKLFGREPQREAVWRNYLTRNGVRHDFCFRRMCSRMDKPKAVTAAAHKLARLIYTVLTKGEEYTDQGQDYYEERYRQRVLRQLAQRAEKNGHEARGHGTTCLKNYSKPATWDVFLERAQGPKPTREECT